MIVFARIEIGTGGLPACVQCGGAPGASMRPAHDIRADVTAVAAAWDGGPGPSIWFAGAEAFAHPELPGLVESAMSVGVERLKISTSGAALAGGQNAMGSLSAGVRHIEIVVLAGEARDHDALAGRQGSFEAAAAGVAAFRNAAEKAVIPISVVGRVPVCSHNVDGVPGAIATFARFGADAVVVGLTPSAANQVTAAWAAAVADTGVVNRVWVVFEGVDAASVGLPALNARAPWDVRIAGTA